MNNQFLTKVNNQFLTRLSFLRSDTYICICMYCGFLFYSVAIIMEFDVQIVPDHTGRGGVRELQAVSSVLLSQSFWVWSTSLL